MNNINSIEIAVVTQSSRVEFLIKLIRSIEIAIINNNGNVNVNISIIGLDINKIKKNIDDHVNDLNIQYLNSNGRVADGRQLALENCVSDYVLFIDDDCVVDEKLISIYSTLAPEINRENIAGAYGVTKFSGNYSDAFEACWHTPFIHPFQISRLYKFVEWAPTSNALFNVEKALEVGGFNTNIPVNVSGEDVDIGIKLNNNGFKMMTEPSAVIYHTTQTWNKFSYNTIRFFNYGRSEAWLIQEQTERKEISIQRIFLLSLFLSFSIILPLFFKETLVFIFGIGLIFYLLIKCDKVKSIKFLRLFLISFLYIFVNSLGYFFQILKSNRKHCFYMCYRFSFYQVDYIQRDIILNGPL